MSGRPYGNAEKFYRQEGAKYQSIDDIEKCKACPLREGCNKEGAKSKTYYVTIGT